MTRRARQCLKVLESFGSEIFPRQNTIAKKMGCKLRNVQAAIAELKREKCVSVRQRPNTSAVYKLAAKSAVPSAVPCAVPPIKSYEFKEEGATRTEKTPEQRAMFGARRVLPSGTWLEWRILAAQALEAHEIERKPPVMARTAGDSPSLAQSAGMA